MSTPRLSKTVRVLLFGLAAGGAGLAVGNLIGRSAKRSGPDVAVLPLILGLLAVTFVVLTVHELGHLAGALTAGFRFQLLTVGPFTLYREGERIRFRWNTDWMQMGGLAAALPGPGADARRGAMRMIVSGPLASYALAVAGGVLFATTGGTWHLAGLMFGLQSLAIGIVTSLPHVMGGYVSDGARYLQLRRGGMEAERWLAIAGFAAQNQAGDRPRQWRLAQATETWVDGTPDGVMMGGALYCWELDRGNTAEAGAWLDRSMALLDAAPSYLHPAMMVEAAWFEAARRGRAAEARGWFDRIEASPLMPRWSLLRAEAAVLAAEGRSEEAAAKRAEALTLLDAAPPSGASVYERALLNGVP